MSFHPILHFRPFLSVYSFFKTLKLVMSIFTWQFTSSILLNLRKTHINWTIPIVHWSIFDDWFYPNCILSVVYLCQSSDLSCMLQLCNFKSVSSFCFVIFGSKAFLIFNPNEAILYVKSSLFIAFHSHSNIEDTNVQHFLW